MTKTHNTIKARIRARKLTLSYFYWRIFVFRLSNNQARLETIIGTSRGLEDVHDKSTDDMPTEQQELSHQLTDSFGQKVCDDINYIASYYFDNWPINTIDMDYAITMGESFDSYYSITKDLVNQHTTSFGFEQMDPTDQALFVMGYIEHTIIHTPKEVIINEMVELAKRYGDGGSAKLIHGIIHHIIS